MKRIIAIIIAALLLVSGIPAFADENVLFGQRAYICGKLYDSNRF